MEHHAYLQAASTDSDEGLLLDTPISGTSSGRKRRWDLHVSCMIGATVGVLLVCATALVDHIPARTLGFASSGQAGSLHAEDADVSSDGCYDIRHADHGSCLQEIEAAKRTHGILHAKRFTGGTGGLTVPARSAPLTEWQALVYKTSGGKCPMPCNMKGIFCKAAPPSALWRPSLPNDTLQIKALSYNLYWWNLFAMNRGTYKGVKNSASKLIAGSMRPAYDVMGFQECEDTRSVLQPVGLLEQYEMILGTHNICMAYRKAEWSLLERGEADVAEDSATEYYGLRGAQWMRLRHSRTGMALFFMNHHGPLHANAGGMCGGVSTAHNLLNLIASKAQEGDAIILVGDFNANAVSTTIQELWKHLVFLYNGDAMGGLDNIFSNIASSCIVDATTLGTGGSDHKAISVTVELGPSTLKAAKFASPVEPAKALEDAEDRDNLLIPSWCQNSLMEPSIDYTFDAEVSTIRNIDGVTDPRVCCHRCFSDKNCKAWTMTEWVRSIKGPRCSLKSGEPSSKIAKPGVMSGLPPSVAVKFARNAAAQAIQSL